MNVYIITYCADPDYLNGTTLIFKTLRTGFPTAGIHVLDNCSAMGSREYIQRCADNVQATYYELQQELNHWDIIEYLLNNVWEGTCVLLDPDVCFWQNCEQWGFDALIAGRLIPRFIDGYTWCITEPRIHTSFWWVPDAGELRKAIQNISERYYDFHPFLPYMYRRGDKWIRFDTGASLYSALIERMHPFTTCELDAYDHLFAGTNYKEVVDNLNEYEPVTGEEFYNIHKQAMSDYRELRGLWKRQEEYFKSKNQAPIQV